MDFSRLTHFLESLYERVGAPSYDCAVYLKGENVYRQSGGFADLEKKTPIERDSLYRFYSMSKPLTCTAGLQLFEKGEFQLSDPLEMYISDFKNMKIREPRENGILVERPCNRPIQIVDLFTMSAGFWESYAEAPAMKRLKERVGENHSTAEFVSAIAEEPLTFEPGSHWRYTYCHDVLGRLIEVISGKRFYEYLRENIFAPLGMDDTFFRVPPEKAARLAGCYHYDAEKKTHTRITDAGWTDVTVKYESGGGGIVSRVDDYAKFANAMTLGGTSKDGVRILGRATIDLMRDNQLDPQRLKDFDGRGSKNIGYGYGLGVRTLISKAGGGSNSSLGEFGWSGAAGTYVLMDPEKQVTIVFATHLYPGPSFYTDNRIRNIVYACLD
ncbi:serine hydrolase [Spirochaetia bacterium]|nr:serine hydrolase [Spirochaetia bacterium]